MLGNDTITGGNGNDDLFGGPGNDNVSGQNGDDSVVGNFGNDTLAWRGNGDDFLNGDVFDPIDRRRAPPNPQGTQTPTTETDATNHFFWGRENLEKALKGRGPFRRALRLSRT